MSTTVDVKALYAALDLAREDRGWSWRQLARDLGLSPSTMSRLANGHKPDVDAFAAIVAWLNADANDFILTDDQRRNRADEPEPELMVKLAPLLRARRDLKDQDVEYLEDLIGAAVRRFKAEAAAKG